MVIVPGTEDYLSTDEIRIAIKEYYGTDNVTEELAETAFQNPDFIDYLRKKIVKKKQKQNFQEDSSSQDGQASDGDEPSGESKTGIGTDRWTFLGVTMKKTYWIFIGIGLATLTLAFLTALLKRK